MNILLLAIDCLRADRLTGGAGELPPIPNLRKLAERGTLFTQAITASVTTTPSFASMLTGRYPPAHGVFSLHGYRLSPSCPTLVEALAQHGYHTFAEVTGPLLELVGLNRGFASYHCRHQQEYLAGSWGNDLIARFRERKFPEPWFGLVHLWELHGPPYVPAEYANEKFGHSRYDRALAALDSQLPRLLSALPADTLVVVLGDHGESLSLRDVRPDAQLRQRFEASLGRFWEPMVIGRDQNGSATPRRTGRGLAVDIARRLAAPWRPRSRYQFFRRWRHGHGWHLFDELVRVPVLFAGPGFPARVVQQQIRTIDVLPTVLECAGATIPSGNPPQGRSVVPLVRGEDKTPRHAYLEAAGSCLPDRRFWLRGLRTEKYKYLYTPFAEPASEELYDLTSDPRERRNIADKAPDVAAQCRGECESIVQAAPAVAEEQGGMTAEDEAVLEDRLRQLGYLE